MPGGPGVRLALDDDHPARGLRVPKPGEAIRQDAIPLAPAKAIACECEAIALPREVAVLIVIGDFDTAGHIAAAQAFEENGGQVFRLGQCFKGEALRILLTRCNAGRNV